MADSILSIQVGLHEAPATVAERALRASENGSAREGIAVLQRLFGGLGVSPAAKVSVRVDSVTRGAAAQTVAVVAADGTAGDTLEIYWPDGRKSTFTAVATGGSAASGTYSLDAGSDTLVAQELRDCINTDTVAGSFVTATESSGTITITANLAGTWAHTIKLKKTVTTGTALTLGASAFTGGDDVLDQATETVTFNTDTNALANNDTLSVGAVTFTWKTSGASGENEINYANVDADDATAFAAAVNAHSKLQGMVSALAAAGVVTLTYEGDPRAGQLLLCAKSETNAGAMTFGNSGIFAAGTTLAYQSDARTYGGRGAA